MKEIFGAGMVAAHERYRNVRDFLCRAKLYEPAASGRPQRSAKKGWRKCDTCLTCKHSKNRFWFKNRATGEQVLIPQDTSCKDKRVIYMIECRKCGVQYIGKTVQSLSVRGRQHIQAVESLCLTQNNKLYTHFTTRGHNHSDMLFFVIERVQGDDFVLASRERFHMDRFQTIYKGLNTNRT